MTTLLTLDEILDAIYGSGKDEADFAKMILKVRSALEDSAYSEPLSARQEEILHQLEEIASMVRTFNP